MARCAILSVARVFLVLNRTFGMLRLREGFAPGSCNVDCWSIVAEV
ncbi:MAG: hypothetical protein QOJ65_2247 [Fimbriimonadaceae bacterium]|nr:hypothetical protein [Fimbriimonadaceae bacterium]